MLAQSKIEREKILIEQRSFRSLGTLLLHLLALACMSVSLLASQPASQPACLLTLNLVPTQYGGGRRLLRPFFIIIFRFVCDLKTICVLLVSQIFLFLLLA